jgi:methyl-accepting chemotaxis protein
VAERTRVTASDDRDRVEEFIDVIEQNAAGDLSARMDEGVDDEVKELAEETQAATDEIETSINNVRQQAEDVPRDQQRAGAAFIGWLTQPEQ